MSSPTVNIARKSRVKRKPKSTSAPVETFEDSEAELAALAEDCERDMYGDDYDYLKTVGWLDR